MEKLPAFIVEDNIQLKLIFRIALEEEFEVLAVERGDLAIEYLRGHSPAVIVLDLNLPGASGQQVLEFARSQPHLANASVILATADAGRADDLSAQADLVLLKPISPIQLKQLATRIVKK